METKSGGKHSNPYYHFRKKAADQESDLHKLEIVANKLHVSVDSLRAYETGKTQVPSDIVVGMCSLYKAPELSTFHCKYICPIGKSNYSNLVYEDFELDRLALRLLKTFSSVSKVRDELINISADGNISPDEYQSLDNILNALDEIFLRAQELRIWKEKNLIVNQQR